MNVRVRCLILALTICALIFIAANQPKPVKAVEVPYCVITYKAIGPDQFGRKRLGWARGYGPCTLLDRYENI